MKMNVLKADGHGFGCAKGTSEIQVSLHRDLNAFGWYAHGRSHHLTGDLCASRQSPKQKITGTCTGTGALAPIGLDRQMIDPQKDVAKRSHKAPEFIVL